MHCVEEDETRRGELLAVITIPKGRSTSHKVVTSPI